MVTGTRLNVTLYVQYLSCYHSPLEYFYMFSQRIKDYDSLKLIMYFS
jgi:hypothetical protein